MACSLIVRVGEATADDVDCVTYGVSNTYKIGAPMEGDTQFDDDSGILGADTFTSAGGVSHTYTIPQGGTITHFALTGTGEVGAPGSGAMISQLLINGIDVQDISTGIVASTPTGNDFPMSLAVADTDTIQFIIDGSFAGGFDLLLAQTYVVIDIGLAVVVRSNIGLIYNNNP